MLLAQPADFRRQRLRFRLPVVALLSQFGGRAFVRVARGDELAGERFVGRAEGGVVVVERGVGCAVLLPGGGEFGGQGFGFGAELVAVGGGIAERFAERALGDLQRRVLGAELPESGRVGLLRGGEFGGERVGFGAERVAFGGQFRVRFFVRGAGRGEVAVEGGALLLAGGGGGVHFGEQLLAFLLRGVALVGELLFFGLEFGDRRVAARAGGCEFAGELGARGAEIFSRGRGHRDSRERGREFRGEAGLFAAEFFVRGAELRERLRGLAAGGFGGGVQLGDARGFGLRLFGERGFFLRLTELRGKALALLVRGAEFVLEFFRRRGVAAVFRGDFLPVRLLRGRPRGELRGERGLFPGDGIALGEQLFDAPAVALDVLFKLRHGPRLPRLRRGCGPGARARFLQLRRGSRAGRVRTFDLLLRLL